MSLPMVKARFSSTTIRACLVAIVAILTSLGINVFSEDDANRLVDAGEAATRPDADGGLNEAKLGELIAQLIALGAAGVAWYGREKAKAQIVSGEEYKRLTGTGHSGSVMLLLCLLPLTAAGCNGFGMSSNAEHITFREGFAAGVDTTFQEHGEWAAVIAGDNNGDGMITDSDGPIDLSRLPQLQALPAQARNAWYVARLLPRREAERLLQEDRRRLPGNASAVLR